MLLWRENINNIPIMSLQTGVRLGQTGEPIIDPSSLKIIAFYCTGRLIEFSPAVLHIDDIREFGNLGFIVNDSDDIMPLDDLVRLQTVLQTHFELMGTKVIDTTQKRLGKVTNYIVDSQTFFIQKLGVQRPFLQSINNTELIIDRQQIREINDEAIVVEAPTVKQTLAEPLETVRFQNPFRHTAQPENINRH